MKKVALLKDPYNLIITGVGGQGNVMASRMLGNALACKGFYITIGETFGVSQRGGSVMSHLRISKKSAWSPQIPSGQADVIVALEPTEAIRVIASYGNPDVTVLSNTRPIYPVGVIAGELKYPGIDEIRAALGGLAGTVMFINATEEAIRLGQPILGNVIMMGAVAGTGLIPFDTDDFCAVMSESMSGDKLASNIEAFERGKTLVRAPKSE
ncbi:MAG: indolepyruvate oxidoreductase subunit beta [Spirochaetes bacterium]|nr:indolepyruvate oxidoreductase subunit beta [Spirochaetota bacterium]